MKMTQSTPDTSFAFAKTLAKVGCKIAPATIRNHWRAGAPRDAAEFMRWLDARKGGATGDPEMRAAKLTKLQKQIAILETQHQQEQIALAKLRGELVKKSFSAFVTQAGLHQTFAELRRRFVFETPPLLAGASAETISASNEKALSNASNELRRHFAENGLQTKNEKDQTPKA